MARTCFAVFVIISLLLLPCIAGASGGEKYFQEFMEMFGEGPEGTQRAFVVDMGKWADSIIATIRTVASIVFVLLVVMAGIGLAGGNEYSKERVKTQMVFALLSLFVIFAAEKIAFFIFSIIGW